MAGRPSYAWKSFCGIMMTIVGILNIIDGLVAITQSNQVKSQVDAQLPLFDNVKTWGWIVLIVGFIVLFAGFALMAGATWGRVVGIIVASVNLVAQLAWLPHNTFWSLTMIAIDVIIIYGIAVHCGREEEALL